MKQVSDELIGYLLYCDSITSQQLSVVLWEPVLRKNREYWALSGKSEKHNGF